MILLTNTSPASLRSAFPSSAEEGSFCPKATFCLFWSRPPLLCEEGNRGFLSFFPRIHCRAYHANPPHHETRDEENNGRESQQEPKRFDRPSGESAEVEARGPGQQVIAPAPGF